MMTLGMPWRLGRPLVRGRLTKMSPFLFQTEYQPDCDHSTSTAFLEPVERTGSHLSKKHCKLTPQWAKKNSPNLRFALCWLLLLQRVTTQARDERDVQCSPAVIPSLKI